MPNLRSLDVRFSRWKNLHGIRFGVIFFVSFQLTAAQNNDIMSFSFRLTNDKAFRFMSTEELGPVLSPQAVRWSFLRLFSFWRNLIIGFLVISPLLIRLWCLSKVPPAAIPFDVDEFCRIEIEPGQNAFDYFCEATRLKEAVQADYKARNKEIPWAEYDAMMAKGWSVATDSLKEWLVEHREAMEVWRRGTECSDSLYVSPTDINFSTMLPAVQELRTFARLAQCDAMRLESEGRLLEAAEKNYLAILRSGHLARRHGCIIQGLVGVALYSVATERLVKWSENSRLTAEELRSVLKQVKDANQHFEPPSTALKIEDLSTIHSLSRTGWCKESGLAEKYEKFEPYASTGMEAFLWILGEPDVARRTVTHVLTNHLREIDKPLSERSPKAETETVGLFVPPADRSSQSFPPAAIERAVQRSTVAKHVMLSFSQFENAVGRNRVRGIELELVLAAQIYFREHGEFPAEATDLIPDCIDSWPADPLQSISGGLMQYERESTTSARIYSAGGWGIDVIHQSRASTPNEQAVP